MFDNLVPTKPQCCTYISKSKLSANIVGSFSQITSKSIPLQPNLPSYQYSMNTHGGMKTFIHPSGSLRVWHPLLPYDPLTV